MFKQFVIFLFCCAFLGIGVVPLFGNELSEDFIRKAHQQLEKNHVDEAAKFYTQALILDPQNMEVKEWLNTISHNKNLDKDVQQEIARLIELMDYISFLAKREQDLVKQIEHNKKFVMRHADQPLVRDSLNLLKIDITKRINDDFDILQSLHEYGMKDIGAYDEIVMQLSKTKDQYIVQVLHLQKKNDNYLAIKNKIVPVKPLKEIVIEPKPLITVTSEKTEPLESKVNLKAEFGKVRGELDVLKAQVEDSRVKVEKITQDLASKTLEVFEKDQLLMEQQQDFVMLEAELIDATERLNLIHRIIEEKDGKISALEKYVSQVKEITLEQDKVSKDQIGQLENQLSQLQDQINNQKDLNAKKLVSLEKYLGEQEKKMAEYDAVIKEKDRSINLLNTKLLVKDKELKDVANILESKDTEALELNGIIQIYQGKLNDTRRQVATSTQIINNLNDRLMKTRQQLDVSEKTTEDLYEKILKLESRFSKIREPN